MDKQKYLEISKASDIKNSKERITYRLLEVMPGIISLGTLVGVFVFSWLLPMWVAVFIICFCFYYLFRIFYFSLHQVMGYFKVKGHMQSDWLAKLKKLPGSANAKIKNWKKLLANRKIAQSKRKLKDREIIKNFTGKIDFQEVANPIVRYILNPIFGLYFKIIKLVIWW